MPGKPGFVGVARYDIEDVLTRRIPPEGIATDPSLPIRITRAEADSYRLDFDPAVVESGVEAPVDLNDAILALASHDTERYVWDDTAKRLYIRIDAAGGVRPGVGGEPEWHVGITSATDRLWNYVAETDNRAGRFEFDGLRFANDWKPRDAGRRTINMQPGASPSFIDCEFIFCGAGDDIIASAGFDTAGDHLMQRVQFVGHGSDGGTMTVFDASEVGGIGLLTVRDNVHHAGWALLNRDSRTDAGLVSNQNVGVLIAVHKNQSRGGIVERNIVLGLPNDNLQRWIQVTPENTPDDPTGTMPLVIQDNWLENVRGTNALSGLVRRTLFVRGLESDVATDPGGSQHFIVVGNGSVLRLESNVIAGAVSWSLLGLEQNGSVWSSANTYVVGRRGAAAIGWLTTSNRRWFGDLYVGGDTIIAGEFDPVWQPNSLGRGGNHVKWFGSFTIASGPSNSPAFAAPPGRVFDLAGRDGDAADHQMTFVPALDDDGVAIGKAWPTHPDAADAVSAVMYRAAFPMDTSRFFADAASLGLPAPINLSTGGTWQSERLVGFDPTDYLPPRCGNADLAPGFGLLDVNDVIEFVNGFNTSSPTGDVNGDGVWNVNDVIVFVTAFNAGCP